MEHQARPAIPRSVSGIQWSRARFARSRARTRSPTTNAPIAGGRREIRHQRRPIPETYEEELELNGHQEGVNVLIEKFAGPAEAESNGKVHTPAETPATVQPLAEVLDEVHDAYARYVVYPSAEHLDAVTLYTAATHGQDVWEHATRIVFRSPVKRCGKTRTLEVMREVAWNVLATTNASVAVLVHSIDENDPRTIILDEADVILGPDAVSGPRAPRTCAGS